MTHDNAVLFGLPVLYNKEVRHRVSRPPAAWETVYFVDQAVLPRTQEDQMKLCDFLLAYARRFPQRKLVVLMKNRPDSVSAHTCGETVADRLRARVGNDGLPANMRIGFDAVRELLQKTDFCITISSTVLIECVAQDIPIAPLADFGFAFALGNEIFRDCGCAATTHDLLNDNLGTLDPAWVTRHLVQSPKHLEAVRGKIDHFVTSRAQDKDLCVQADMLIEYVRADKRAAFQKLPLKAKISKVISRQRKRLYRLMGLKFAGRTV